MDSPTPQDLSQYIQTLKQLKELTTNSNPWIPLWSAIAGGLIASIPNGIGTILKARSNRKAVETALLVEIASIAGLIRKRKYLEIMKSRLQNITEINNQIDSTDHYDDSPRNYATAPFPISVTKDRHTIYKANLQHLGTIDKAIAVKIVTFHRIIESLILDLEPTGSLGSVGSADDYSEAITFLEEALTLADELTRQIP